ncbi:hypothetical protein [Pseudomonas putida]
MGSLRQQGIYIGKTTQPADVVNLALLPDEKGLPSLAECLCQATARDQALLLGADACARDAALSLALEWGAMRRRDEGRIITVGVSVPFGDLAALHAAVDAQTVAIMLQPLADADAYLQGVEQLCRALDILLIIDDADLAPTPTEPPRLFQRLSLALARARSQRLH